MYTEQNTSKDKKVSFKEFSTTKPNREHKSRKTEKFDEVLKKFCRILVEYMT